MNAETAPTLDIWDAKDYSNIAATQKWLKGIQSFRLDRNNVEKPYPLSYLAATDSEGATFIFDCIGGFHFKFKAFDINGDGETELLVFYHTGGNAYKLAIYSIACAGKRSYTPKDISKWNTEMICSNRLASIEAEKGKITVATHDYDSENHGGYLIIEYSVQDKAVKEAKKESFKYAEK